MNPFFNEYVATAKALALERGLEWGLAYDDKGKVSKGTRWNLTELVGMLPPPNMWLGQIGVDPAAFEKLNDIRRRMNQEPLTARPMPEHWRNLYQAVFVHQLIVQKTKPRSAMQIAIGVRRLAQAAGDTLPWEVTPDQVQQAYNAVLQAAESGKLALDFAGTIRNVLDGQKLADTPALARFCVPYLFPESRTAQTRADALQKRQNAHGGHELRRSLSERKSASKLPDEGAFWELVRIVFTETPLSFTDAIRFAAYRLLIMMGFRIGEAALLPLDWKRWREYLDTNGRPAGESGGFSRSLGIRHFAEKQVEDERPEGLSLYEKTPNVPPIFEEILIETLDHVAVITAPLRERLRRQTETGRIFPEYPLDALIPAWEMYVRMTGNAVFSDAKPPPELISQYRNGHDPGFLTQIRDLQLSSRPSALTKFWRNPAQRNIEIRTADGTPAGARIDWRHVYVSVGEVENHIRENRATKLSDSVPAALIDGTLVYPHELLFIMPVRNLIEGRNGGILDTTLYSAVGRIDAAQQLNAAISGKGSETIFERYGLTDEDRALRLTSHALRHLLTTELIRLGVADTIIGKMLNRRSVQQNSVYDHRSLAEDLANIDVPPEAEEALGDKALQVYKLIIANKGRGPVVDEFRRVQREYGDDAAFDYLNAEADGLHATPYGLYINSFTSDPCPKHLECFNGCLHLMRNEVADERANLERMRDRFEKVIDRIESIPADRRNTGWANQLQHARVRLENIVKALATEPGMQPFPDGPDLSVTAENTHGGTILDTMNRLRNLDD